MVSYISVPPGAYTRRVTLVFRGGAPNCSTTFSPLNIVSSSIRFHGTLPTTSSGAVSVSTRRPVGAP